MEIATKGVMIRRADIERRFGKITAQRQIFESLSDFDEFSCSDTEEETGQKFKNETVCSDLSTDTNAGGILLDQKLGWLSETPPQISDNIDGNQSVNHRFTADLDQNSLTDIA